MLAYGSGRPRIAERRSSPNAMLIVISAHVALVAVIMSVKMGVAPKLIRPPIEIQLVHDQKPPPPHSVAQPVRRPMQQSTVEHSQPSQQPIVRPPTFTPLQTLPETNPLPPIPIPLPTARPTPVPEPVTTGAQLLTPPFEIKPPYPESKLLSGEEATLKLRLTIDPAGRVTAVEPIGAADRAFLDSARRHIMAHWRYRPATRDGRAVATSIVITLEFRLDG